MRRSSLLLTLAGLAGLVLTTATTVLADDDPITLHRPIALFNGRDLTGWTTWLADTHRDDPRQVFSVDDGMIRISGDGLGYLATQNTYRDYRLVVDFRWGERNWRDRQGRARDSGLFLHSTGPDGNSFDGGGAYTAAFECQIMQGAVGDMILIRGKHEDGSPVPLRATARVASTDDSDGWPTWQPSGAPRTLETWGRINWRHKDPTWRDEINFRGARDVESPADQWTRLECVCDGDRLSVFVNGTLVNEAYDLFPTSGRILLQCEGAEILYRKVELQPLDDDVGATDTAAFDDEPCDRPKRLMRFRRLRR